MKRLIRLFCKHNYILDSKDDWTAIEVCTKCWKEIEWDWNMDNISNQSNN